MLRAVLKMPRTSARRRRSGADRPAAPQEPFAYDAFISYSREADRDLARALHHGLHSFAKPWYRLRALRVFRDEGSLAAGSRLWGSIQQALDSSRYLVLLAGEKSASAPWVEQEIEYWCTRRGVDHLIIVLTDPPCDGSRQPPGMVWDARRGDFDWQRTVALPKCLAGHFEEEPIAVLLGWARARPELSLRDPEFRTEVAGLAAPLHGVDKDALIGEDVRRHRQTRRRVRVVLAVMAALTTIAAFAAVTAVQQRDRARDQTALAEVRQYAAESRSAKDPFTAAALAIAAEQRVTPALPEARTAFGEAVGRLDGWTARLVGQAPVAPSTTGASLVWSPDGSQIWVAGPEGGVARWAVWHGDEAVQTWKAAKRNGDDPVPYSFQLTQDRTSVLQLLRGKRFGQDRYVVHDAVSGRVTKGPFPLDSEWLPGPRTLSPRGDLLAVEGHEGGVRLVDVGTGRQHSSRLPGAMENITALVWSPDGERLAAVGDTGVQVWDATRGRLLWSEQREHGHRVLSWSPDGRRLVTAGEDGALAWWNTRTGEVTADSALGDGSNAREISWSPDGARVAVADFGGTIRLLDPNTGNAVGQALARASKYSLGSTLVWSPDSRFLAGAFVAGGTFAEEARSTLLRLWEIALPARDTTRLHGPTDAVLAVSWSPDGRRIAGGSGDGTVWIWDAKTRKPVPGTPQRQRHALDLVKSIAWDPSGRRLLRVGGIGLRMWRVASTQDAPQPWWGSGGATAAAWSPDSSQVASGTDKGAVQVWNTATGKRARHQPQPITAGAAAPENGVPEVRSVAWSPDGLRVAAVMEDGSLHLWEAATGQRWGSPPKASLFPARTMSWSPDGELIAVGDVDGTIRLWDGGAGTPIPGVMQAGDSSVESLAWAPDSTRLASGDGAGTIRVWEPRRGITLQQREDAHSTSVTALSWSPDGARLVSGGADREVRLWRGRTEQEICRLVDEALHRTRSTPALAGATGTAARTCSRPDRIRSYPELPLQPR